MASPIVDSWVYATMMIQNEWGSRGTGFLVARQVAEGALRIFLVTNKHVLNQDQKMRQNATRVVLHLNVKNPDGSVVGQTAEMPLVLPDGSKRWREHLDKDVDVLAIDVTPLLVQYPQIEKRWADYSIFGDKAKLDELDVTMAEEVLVIGYPHLLGFEFRQGSTNLPLVRSGIIASRIGETIQESYGGGSGSIQRRVLRGFLVDGATIPGSSGSPVVLKPVTGRYSKGNIIMGITPPILLGVVAETMYAPVKTSSGALPSFAGLGLAFDAETIRETIEIFFH